MAADESYNGATNTQSFTINQATSSISYVGNRFGFDGAPKSPVISFTGSSGDRTTNYVGTGSTSYGPSATAPTSIGTYYVSNTVAADVNYLGATNSQTFAIASPYLAWLGDASGNGNWDTSSLNWNYFGATTNYTDGLVIVLDDTANGSGTLLVTNIGQVQPASVAVNVTNKNYNIYGNGIAGSTSLTKNGSGTLTLSGTNTYSSGTTNSAGTLKLANQYALTNSTLTMNGGSLVFDSSVSGNAFTLGALAASSSGAGYNIALQNNAGSPAAIALTVGGNNTTRPTPAP